MSNPNETMWERTVRKFSAEPLVPMGCLITAGVLASGIRAFHRKDGVKSQQMMRLRVLAQGATVAVLVTGASFGMKPHDRPKTYEEKLKIDIQQEQEQR